MTDVSFTVSENVTAVLDQAIAFGEDMSPAMKSIARMMVTETQFNFEGQHTPAGVPWKPRAAGQGDHPILRKSGDLFGSLREDYGPDHAAAGPEASGGAAIYARIHQLGGTIRASGGKALNTPFGPRKSVTIPARDYLGWNDRMSGKAVDILTGHLRSLFAGGSAAETSVKGA